MNNKLTNICILAFFCFVTSGCCFNVIVPAGANPWLAGMPNGTQTARGMFREVDSAPDQSPVLISGDLIQPNTKLRFSATGIVSFAGNEIAKSGPDGNFEINHPFCQHDAGAEFYKSDIKVRLNSLIGVFLSDSFQMEVPEMLDFIDQSAQDYLVLNPVIQQVFFIGDGLTLEGVQQEIVVPENATRLYLGTMDGSGWNNNMGEFKVKIFN